VWSVRERCTRRGWKIHFRLYKRRTVKTVAKWKDPQMKRKLSGNWAEPQGNNQPRDIMIVENLNRATLKIIAEWKEKG
jgi:hypothetical protein